MPDSDRYESTLVRFVQRIALSTGCWLWMGATNTSGYGLIRRRGDSRQTLTHRLAWEWWFGPIPDGMSVLHRCDVRTCVRPSHLFLGTYSDNAKDAVAKGRMHPVWRTAA